MCYRIPYLKKTTLSVTKKLKTTEFELIIFIQLVRSTTQYANRRVYVKLYIGKYTKHRGDNTT